MKVIDAAPVLNCPAKHKALLGSTSGAGKLIPCEDLRPTIFDEGVTYEYVGTMDGIGIYRQASELRELEAEQTDRQITGGDQQ